MRIYISISLLICICLSCNSKKSTPETKNIDTSISVHHDTLHNQLATGVKKQIIAKDTTLEFDIEGLSSESSEVKAHYINDTIQDAIWTIFGETGQSIIHYTFLKDGTIKTSEKNYTYETDLNAVRSKKDIHLKNSIQYIIDTSGKLLSKMSGKNSADIFMDFKQTVPLILSSIEQLKQ